MVVRKISKRSLGMCWSHNVEAFKLSAVTCQVVWLTFLMLQLPPAASDVRSTEVYWAFSRNFSPAYECS